MILFLFLIPHQQNTLDSPVNRFLAEGDARIETLNRKPNVNAMLKYHVSASLPV